MTFPSSRQRGITLVLALLFLVIITLITVAGFNSSTTNTRVTGNMMVRQEATAAAQVAIEEVVSSTVFTVDPDAVAAGTYPVDVDGDGTTDYSAVLTPKPTCYRVRTIRMTELDPTLANDRACMISSSGVNTGIDSAVGGGTPAGASLCSNTEWNVRSTVTDTRTGTRANLNQGVAVRVPITDASNACS
jgi:uncharacterized membrane protein (DUF485 family)